MRVAAATGLACVLATGVTAAAQAQVSGAVTLATDYRLRGVSLTDQRGAAVLSLAYDHASGAYVGGSVVADDPPYQSARVLGWQGYAGVAGRLAQGAAWDVGVGRVDMEPYLDRRYSLEYTQVYAGLSQGPISGRLSLASGYPREGVKTLYAELNGALRPADAWRLTGHVGLQSRLNDRRSGQKDERLDATVGVVRAFGKRAQAELTFTAVTPRPEPHATWTRSGLAASVTVYF